MASGMLDRLTEACSDPSSYPEGLLRQVTVQPVLSAHRIRLKNNEHRLFNDTQSHLVIREVAVGAKEYTKTIIKDLASLRSHFDPHLLLKQKDARSCHVFLSAESSIAPTYITAAMFRYLCTYFQIPPCFLDLFLSLGTHTNSRNFHSVGFFEDNQSKPTNADSHLATPELGRSGWTLRHCYKLQGMELPKNSKRWTLRQTIAYHSFDLENGRCFWFTIKGDIAVRERIMEGAKSYDNLHPTALSNLQGGFKASLATHLLHLEWCTEGWRWYIDETEARLEKILKRVKLAPVDQSRRSPGSARQAPAAAVVAVSSPKSPLRRSSTLSRVGTKITQTLRQASWVSKEPDDAQMHPKLRRGNTGLEAQEAAEEYDTLEKSLERMEEVMAMFSLSELQKLTSSIFDLQEAKLAMNLNNEVMKGLQEAYEYLLASPECPEAIITDCSKDLTNFLRRIRSFQRIMVVECLRIDTLISQLSEGKHLYDAILQFRNTEINHQNAVNARISALRVESVTDDMHDIAKKTERDTSSMHVIRFFTLVFLPGTFLGTFFSTPIFNGDEDFGGNGWRLNSGLLELFWTICGPMMVLTILIWWLYMVIVGRQARQRLQAEVERQGQADNQV